MKNKVSILRLIVLGPFLFIAILIAIVVKLFIYLFEFFNQLFGRNDMKEEV